MRIAVNTRLLLKNRMEGTGWFAYECLKRITAAHPEHEFHFIFDRPFDTSFVFSENVKPHYIGPPARHPLLWYIWFEFSLPYLLRKIKPDIFLSPESYIPLKTKIPALAVMHDIAYEHYPETVPKLVGRYYRYFFPRFAAKAKLIATVSSYSKQDIVSYYKVPENKVRVVYNGCDESFREISEEEKTATRLKWSDGKSYFMFVGGLYPRKNLKRLIQAFELFKETDQEGTKLLLVGKKAFQAEELEEARDKSPFRQDIIFIGRVEGQKELNSIISASIALTYVSVFEGFGIPCIEAMRCGTAVIASDTSSMPEVCGEAAFYIDPFSIESIAEGMKAVSIDPLLRNDLIEKGQQQYRKFSWDKTAELLWSAAEELL
jgi:glycosyltransferase involved in cell wall biosynthesis